MVFLNFKILCFYICCDHHINIFDKNFGHHICKLKRLHRLPFPKQNGDFAIVILSILTSVKQLFILCFSTQNSEICLEKLYLMQKKVFSQIELCFTFILRRAT